MDDNNTPVMPEETTDTSADMPVETEATDMTDEAAAE
jgi:hypothetical protein